MKKTLLLFIILWAAPVYAQTVIDGAMVITCPDGTCSGSGGVGGGLTDVQLRATPVPVSGTVTFSNTTIVLGAGANVIGHVICDSGCAAGAPGQQTMAASSPVVIASNQSAVPVTGTFYQVTQPVSGTFWQTTQPVSGTVSFSNTTIALSAGSAVIGHVIVDTAPSTAVTNIGTFAVQAAATLAAETTKVIGTVNQGTSPWVTTGAGGTFPVTGTFWQATQPVSGTFFQATQPVSGTFFQATQPVSIAAAVTVTQASITKGSQGSTGVTTQDLKDAGRTAISFYANNVASGTTTTETLITLTQSKGTGSTSSSTTYTITSGKTLRLTAIQVAARGNATATIQSTIFNLRLNTAGACVVTSTPILLAAQAATAAVASAWDRVIIPIPDGYEIAGNGTISLCISAAATFVTNAPTWSVNLIGFEY